MQPAQIDRSPVSRYPWVLLLMLLVFLFVAIWPTPVLMYAQEAGEAAAAEATNGEQTTYLEWAARSLGWFYGLVFLGLSVSFVALLVMNLIIARRVNMVPDTLIAEFQKLVGAKQYQQAYDLARADESFLGHVLAAGMSNVSSGYDSAMNAMQGIGEEENMKVEHRLSYLALIGSVAPMVGLLGTVDGMIMSFRVIALTSTGAPDPQSLADGVATALFTTLVGLLLAIPAIASFNLLRNRVARFVFEIGVVSESLMSPFKKSTP
jgi:biopolymer transport protein ExbB